MPEVIFAVGIPCSGKSTWAWQKAKVINGIVLSRESIAKEFFGENYKASYNKECIVTDHFDVLFDNTIRKRKNIIIDNNNLSWGYIYPYVNWAIIHGYDVKFQYFRVSLFKAYIRNIIKYWFTGKLTSFKTIKDLYKEFKNLVPYENRNLLSLSNYEA